MKLLDNRGRRTHFTRRLSTRHVINGQLRTQSTANKRSHSKGPTLAIAGNFTKKAIHWDPESFSNKPRVWRGPAVHYALMASTPLVPWGGGSAPQVKVLWSLGYQKRIWMSPDSIEKFSAWRRFTDFHACSIDSTRCVDLLMVSSFFLWVAMIS